MSPSRTPRSTGANMRVSAAVLSLLAIALLVLDPDAASAGRYEVVQCDRANRAFTDADFDRVNGGDYGFLYRCEEDEVQSGGTALERPEQGRDPPPPPSRKRYEPTKSPRRKTPIRETPRQSSPPQ